MSNTTDSTFAPSHPLDSPTDHRSLLNVFSWFLAVVTALIVLTRLGTRWAVSRTVGLDDFFIIVSTLLAMGQTSALSIGVLNGLGQVDDAVSQEDLEAQQKSIYAGVILFLLSQCCAKISITMFIQALTPVRLHRTLTKMIIVAVIFWATTGVFAFSFQCQLPQTWKFVDNTCVNRTAVYTYVEVFNILLDTTLVLLPSAITWNLQLPTKPKFVVIGFFMSRIFVISASIAQLVLIYHAASSGMEPFLSWTFSLSLSLIQYLGIITACGPYLKPFLESLNSGMIGNDDLRRRAGSSKALSSSNSSRKVRKLFNTAVGSNGADSPLASPLASKLGRSANFTNHELKGMGGGEHERSRSENFVTVEGGRRESEWDLASHSSRSRFITQTTSYRVSDGPEEEV